MSLKAEPNLTPMLDMVFQLVTFFMLVINFKTNQIDMAMDLPVVGTARPVNTDGQLTLLMININNKGKYTVFNRPFTDFQMEQYVAAQAATDRLAARRLKSSFDDLDDLPTTVVIRADRNTPFEKLDRVLKLCQENHYRDFVFRAASSKSATSQTVRKSYGA
jgi:biopolymer transport protein ExbD